MPGPVALIAGQGGAERTKRSQSGELIRSRWPPGRCETVGSALVQRVRSASARGPGGVGRLA